MKISPRRLEVLKQIFGKETVEHELRKFESNPHDALDWPGNLENKEMFDGTNYTNIPRGDRKVITEPQAVEKTAWVREVRICKSLDAKRIVIGEVYVPFDPNDPSTVDTHGHAATAEEIEKAAYDFMRALNNNKIDVQHNFIEGYGTVVESYIAKAGDPLFKQGTWVLGVHVTDDQVWTKIMKGEITGFSLAGSAHLVDPENMTDSLEVDGGVPYGS